MDLNRKQKQKERLKNKKWNKRQTDRGKIEKGDRKIEEQKKKKWNRRWKKNKIKNRTPD